MGWLDKLFPTMEAPIAEARVLEVPSGRNIRELGGYDTPDGPVRYHRFLRSGSTQYLNHRDIERLRDYGVTHVLDLRGALESPQSTCCFARQRAVTWANVELYDCDISDPRLTQAARTDDWLVDSYLSMLANHAAVRAIIEFCASAPRTACLLFHCAAGMDRTGMTAMLLLGLVGVSRDDIIRDYGYSFGTVDEVDHAVETGECAVQTPWMNLTERLDAIAAVYDTLINAYGDVHSYLLDCGVGQDVLEKLRARLLEQ